MDNQFSTGKTLIAVSAFVLFVAIFVTQLIKAGNEFEHTGSVATEQFFSCSETNSANCAVAKK